VGATYGNERGELGALLGALRRRAWIVVLTVVVAMGVAFAYSKSQTKQYQATAQLLFQPLYLDATLNGVPLQLPSADPTKSGGTDVALVTLPQVRDLAATMLGPRFTPDDVKNDVSVSASSSSNIVSVTGTASDPQTAANYANAVANSYVSYRRAQLISAINAAEKQVLQQQSAPGVLPAEVSLLHTDYTRLVLLASVQPDDVQFVSSAQPPTTPSSPKTALDVIIGGLLGLVLGLAIAFAIEATDSRVRRPDELEETLDLPLLATVPSSRALRKGRGIAGLSGSEAEAFRFLRENLHQGDEQSRCVLITSAAPGSGKTTVALHLAAAAAAGTVGEVLLIEADLRRPRLSQMLDLPDDRGLSTLLRSNESVGDVVVHVPTGAGGNGAGADAGEFFPGSFDVLGAGPAHPSASELLRSHRMREILRTAAIDYGLVVIDGPPPGYVADAIPLMAQADGVIIVARVGHESGPELRRLRAELERHGVEPLGVVANFSRPVKNPYTFSGR